MMSTADFWQYASVFGALVAAAFGAPIPEELPIASGGVMVGRAWNDPDTGMHWWIMLPLCILGVVLCDSFLYWVGRKWGRYLLRLKWVQRRILSPERLHKIEQNFHQYGIRILLVARVMPGIRTPVFLSAGIVRLPFRRFLFADAIYALPGVSAIFWLAWLFTDQFMYLLHKVEGYREPVMIALLSFAAGFVTCIFVRRPVSTGSPEEIPVLGKPMVTIANPTVPVEMVDGNPVPDGRAHGPVDPNASPMANAQPPAPVPPAESGEADDLDRRAKDPPAAPPAVGPV